MTWTPSANGGHWLADCLPLRSPWLGQPPAAGCYRDISAHSVIDTTTQAMPGVIVDASRAAGAVSNGIRRAFTVMKHLSS